MINFLKIHWIAIVATISLVQPWIIALWKKFWRRGKLEIYESGNIEISYGPFGPVLSLYGTMRSLHRDIFVKSIDLQIIREKDKSQHTFQWLAFRPLLSELSSQQHISSEIPYSFLVSSTSPHRYNIVFADLDLYNEIKPQNDKYISEWFKLVERVKEKLPFTEGVNIPPEAIKEIENFRQSQIRIATYELLERKCYWEPGVYTLFFNVRTSKGNKTYTKKYCFTLNEEHCKNLKLNVITILEEPISNFLRRKNYPYYYAYAQYKDEPVENKS